MPSTGAGCSSRTRSGRRGVGRDVNYPLESWFTCSSSAGAPNSAAAGSQSGTSSAAANRGKGKGVARATPYKRSRVMQMGVFQAENGVTTINPGLPSQIIVSTRPRKIIRSEDVSGDIVFKPTSGLKWKGSKAITTRRLQEIRDQAKANASNNASQSTTSSLSRNPWKL